MHELRKAQDALSKAIDRRQKDIQLMEKEFEILHTTTSPVKLAESEVDYLVDILKTELPTPDFEPET